MSDDLTFSTASQFGVHYARCAECETMNCPGGLHGWAGIEDVRHALATGQPDPSGLKCGCHCADGPVLEQTPDEFERFDDNLVMDDPCEICGELGACGYDSLGRPMIHAWDKDHDEDAEMNSDEDE